MSDTACLVIALILIVAGLGLLHLTNSGLLPYHVLGLSLHEELGHLVEAGLTPYEALEAGTRSAAEALGRLDGLGTVTEGRRADLILLEENPPEDVTHVGKRVGVMLGGFWLPDVQVHEMLDALLES